jgi:hypothetical protein
VEDPICRHERRRRGTLSHGIARDVLCGVRRYHNGLWSRSHACPESTRLGGRVRRMTAEDVVELYSGLLARRVRLCVDGGWASTRCSSGRPARTKGPERDRRPRGAPGPRPVPCRARVHAQAGLGREPVGALPRATRHGRARATCRTGRHCVRARGWLGARDRPPRPAPGRAWSVDPTWSRWA